MKKLLIHLILFFAIGNLHSQTSFFVIQLLNPSTSDYLVETDIKSIDSIIKCFNKISGFMTLNQKELIDDEVRKFQESLGIKNIYTLVSKWNRANRHFKKLDDKYITISEDSKECIRYFKTSINYINPELESFSIEIISQCYGLIFINHSGKVLLNKKLVKKLN
jgi:hypothetical protein